MFLNHHDDTRQLASGKATALLQSDRIQPDLGPIGIALDVHMRRFGSVTGVEEESIWTNAEDGRHFSIFIVSALTANTLSNDRITLASAADTQTNAGAQRPLPKRGRQLQQASLCRTDHLTLALADKLSTSPRLICAN